MTSIYKVYFFIIVATFISCSYEDCGGNTDEADEKLKMFDFGLSLNETQLKTKYRTKETFICSESDTFFSSQDETLLFKVIDKQERGLGEDIVWYRNGKKVAKGITWEVTAKNFLGENLQTVGYCIENNFCVYSCLILSDNSLEEKTSSNSNIPIIDTVKEEPPPQIQLKIEVKTSVDALTEISIIDATEGLDLGYRRKWTIDGKEIVTTEKKLRHKFIQAGKHYVKLSDKMSGKSITKEIHVEAPEEGPIFTNSFEIGQSEKDDTCSTQVVPSTTLTLRPAKDMVIDNISFYAVSVGKVSLSINSSEVVEFKKVHPVNKGENKLLCYDLFFESFLESGKVYKLNLKGENIDNLLLTSFDDCLNSNSFSNEMLKVEFKDSHVITKIKCSFNE